MLKQIHLAVLSKILQKSFRHFVIANKLNYVSLTDWIQLTHPRTDNIVHFYYFKVKINELWVRLNVAKDVHVQTNGKIQIKYYLYSINDIRE